MNGFREARVGLGKRLLGCSLLLGLAVVQVPAGFGQAEPPVLLSAAPLDGSVFLQWHAEEEAMDHVVAYRPSGGSGWITFAHPPCPAPGILVDGLANGVSHDFRVSRITSDGESESTELLGITPQVDFIPRWCEVVLATGQSLAMGAFSFPVLSGAQQGTSLMLSAARDALIPLEEPVTGADGPCGETMTSGLLNTLAQYEQAMGGDRLLVACLAAGGALTYADLMQGSDKYAELLRDLDSVKHHCLVLGRPAIVSALTVIHGETDEYSGTTADEYAGHLVEWQQAIDGDARARTGQPDTVVLLTDQMSSWMSFGSAVPHTALGQLAASEADGARVVLVTPKYIFDSVDWLSHMTNYSSRRLGEHYAKAYRMTVREGHPWHPLKLDTAIAAGSTILARFHVPVPPLRFDTTMVSARADFGFEYADDCQSAVITGVEIVSDTEVSISLSTPPTCAQPRLRYAFTGIVGSWTGRHVPGAIGGNLRDSDSTQAAHLDASVPADFSNSLFNWCVSFDKAIGMEGSTAQAAQQAQRRPVVWPNPARERLCLGSGVAGQRNRFTIIDAFGRVQRAGSLMHLQEGCLSLEGLASGAYILQLSRGAGDAPIRFVVE